MPSRPADAAPVPAASVHLHAQARVAVTARQADQMARVVAAVEQVAALPAYRAAVLAHAPASARHDPGTPGVFFGFDFHLTADGPRLIEINTNAGGALLHVARADARPEARAAAEERFHAMFAEEWRIRHGDRPLGSVAIVDDHPEGQGLYTEFVLFRRLFERHGLHAEIVDARHLACRDGALWHGERRIDLVYNRLTDFGLDQAAHRALRQAYLDDAALVTPHPRAHALFADKRNLVLLGDRDTLVGWGVDPATADLLAGAVPPTMPVDAAHADALWRDRRRLFFKPVQGYGSKGAYRGDKLTTRVWGEILKADYVAQAYVPASEERVAMAAGELMLKCDIRNYAYRGRVQLLAARLYQGQTTNLRTPGGGFACVEIVPDVD